MFLSLILVFFLRGEESSHRDWVLEETLTDLEGFYDSLDLVGIDVVLVRDWVVGLDVVLAASGRGGLDKGGVSTSIVGFKVFSYKKDLRC